MTTKQILLVLEAVVAECDKQNMWKAPPSLRDAIVEFVESEYDATPYGVFIRDQQAALDALKKARLAQEDYSRN